MTLYKQISENNKIWVDSKISMDPDFFTKLVAGQSPEYLYIGCSDSRIPPNEIMGMEAGELFVHRNLGNMVINNDLNALSVINYAVIHLEIKHIIICGHYNCGAILAAMQSKDLGLLNPWLRNIRDVYRIHQEELDAIANQEERYRRLVEVNVIEQCINVTKTAEVQTSYAKGGLPIVHGWVFDFSTGFLTDLDFNFDEKLKEIQKIYNLSTTKWY